MLTCQNMEIQNLFPVHSVIKDITQRKVSKGIWSFTILQYTSVIIVQMCTNLRIGYMSTKEDSTVKGMQHHEVNISSGQDDGTDT